MPCIAVVQLCILRAQSGIFLDELPNLETLFKTTENVFLRQHEVEIIGSSENV